MSQKHYKHIETTPGVKGGKPRIVGRRITVESIVVWHEWQGRSADEICTDYDLRLAQVYAALAYYYDHQAEIDQSLKASEELIGKVKAQTPSKLKEPVHDQVLLG